jgi:hypothetical protein
MEVVLAHAVVCLHVRNERFLWPGVKPRLIFLASFWLSNIVIMSKVAGTLRQRYPKCRAASKVFNSPHPKIALYRYSMSMTSKVMNSV